MTEIVKKERIKKVKVHKARMFFDGPEWLKDAAVEAAHAEGVGFSEYIRDLIKADLATRDILAIKIKKVA